MGRAARLGCALIRLHEGDGGRRDAAVLARAHPWGERVPADGPRAWVRGRRLEREAEGQCRERERERGDVLGDAECEDGELLYGRCWRERGTGGASRWGLEGERRRGALAIPVDVVDRADVELGFRRMRLRMGPHR